MKIKYCKNFIIVNPDLLDMSLDAKHTYFVGGATRSGTSAISYILKKSGIYMGPSQKKNHEFDEIGQNLDKPKRLEKIINSTNKSYEVWGMKYPKATLFASYFANVLRNPIFILSYRNVISTSKSTLFRNPKYSEMTFNQFVNQYNNNLNYYNHMILSIRSISKPFILVEYEKMLIDAEAFVEEFTNVLNIVLKENEFESLVSDIRTPGYKSLK